MAGRREAGESDADFELVRLCKQGDEPDRLYPLRIGFVNVTKARLAGEVILQ